MRVQALGGVVIPVPSRLARLYAMPQGIHQQAAGPQVCKRIMTVPSSWVHTRLRTAQVSPDQFSVICGLVPVTTSRNMYTQVRAQAVGQHGHCDVGGDGGYNSPPAACPSISSVNQRVTCSIASHPSGEVRLVTSGSHAC
jgi:hypothetical protein